MVNHPCCVIGMYIALGLAWLYLVTHIIKHYNRKPRNKELSGLIQAQDPAATSSAPTATDIAPKSPIVTFTNGPNASIIKSTNTIPSATNVPNNVAFANPLGGIQMPLIKKLASNSGANFEVNGSKFQNIGAAHNRQCDIQVSYFHLNHYYFNR
ncbi:hypothetical protein [endosymbiont GvMRE of Glomus versiforme]|uniref:hypothetical protein n=1 Tax=endosymbiont GvMRE of Glomus versiforme TaxID=2039283 RepID=UPI000EDACBF4|nr:hypothetical protein [endosymbiont GvMRE of Glomus versiforme]RHZ35352.1 Microneme/rhoptry antigen [endosymbiont GvMRE of Glomus versiforme]